MGQRWEGTPVSFAEAAAASDPGPHKHFAFEKMLTSSLCAVLRGHRGQSLISSRCLVALTINKANETSRPLTSTSRREAALASQRACLVLARQAAHYLAGPESEPATPASFVLVFNAGNQDPPANLEDLSEIFTRLRAAAAAETVDGGRWWTVDGGGRVCRDGKNMSGFVSSSSRIASLACV